MPEPVIFVRGFPPFLGHLAASGGMVDDLKVIAGLSDEQVAGLRQRLNAAKGFLDPRLC